MEDNFIENYEESLNGKTVPFLDEEEYLDLISYYNSVNEFNKALRATDNAKVFYPTSVEIAVATTNTLLNLHKDKEAEKEFSKIKQEHSSNITVLNIRFLIRNNQREKAKSKIKEVLATNKDVKEICLILGNMLMCENETKKAITYYLKALTVENYYFYTNELHNLIYCYFINDEGETAIAYLNKLIDHNPYSEVAWRELSYLYYISQEYQLSIDAADFVLAIEPQNTEALELKAEGYHNLGNLEQSLENFMDCLPRNRNKLRIYTNIAQIYKELEEYEKSIKYNKLSIEYHGKEEDIKAFRIISYCNCFTEIALCYEALGDFRKAFHYINHNVLFLKKREIPANSLFLAKKAIYLFRLGEKEQAHLLLQELITFDTKDEETMANVSVLYLLFNDFDGLTVYLESNKGVEPTPHTLLLLAISAYCCGDKEPIQTFIQNKPAEFEEIITELNHSDIEMKKIVHDILEKLNT